MKLGIALSSFIFLGLSCASNKVQTNTQNEIQLHALDRTDHQYQDCIIIDNLLSKQYSKSDTLSKVFIDHCERIPDNCFSFCQNLQSVILSENIVEIEEYSFFACKKLDYVNLNHVKTLGNSCFKFTNLSKADLSEAIEIGEFSFSNCDSLSEISLGRAIERIGDFSFYSDTMLVFCVIPNAEVGNGAFMNCKNLQSIYFMTDENRKTTIGESIFLGCSSLKEVVLPYGLSEIPANAFWGCSALRTIVIPESVKKIGESAFQNSGLESIVIPQSITNISDNAFADCKSLKEVYLNNEDSIHYTATSFPSNTIIIYRK